MIPKRYFVPLGMLIFGLFGVFLTGRLVDMYLSLVVLGTGLTIIAYFDDDMD